MSVTITDIKYSDLIFIKKNSKYVLDTPANIEVYYTKNKKEYKLSVKLKTGFRTDGASVPTIFSWFLPKWDNKNMTYNCAAIVHDCLYTLEGACNFTREESDDFLRGIWRISGISRFKAGVGDLCVGWFAGGESHWGSDDLDNDKNDLIKAYVTKP